MFKPLETVLELTKAGYRPISNAKPRHFAAVGKFLLTVGTEIDGRIKEALQQQIYSDEDTLARAIVGDMGVGEAMAALKPIAQSRSPSEGFLQETETLFKEIDKLKAERNIITHQTCQISKNSLAFHNASFARTDAAIKVSTYTLKEVDELTRYATRLGFRLVRWLGKFPKARILPPSSKAYVAMQMEVLLMKSTSALIQTKSLKRDRIERLKQASHAAHEAMGAYVEIARNIDPNFTSAYEKASIELSNFAATLLSASAPDDAALMEIPKRLQSGQNRQSANKSKKVVRTKPMQKEQ